LSDYYSFLSSVNYAIDPNYIPKLRHINIKRYLDMNTYALIGAAGYIAGKHMKAIKETGGKLILAYDPVDSVGILDTWSPDCLFTTNEGVFWNSVDLRKPDYLVICTPNFCHWPNILSGSFYNCKIICEKPLVITNTAFLSKIPQVPIYPILQLRIHPEARRMKEYVAAIPEGDRVFVNIDYVTYRGQWYSQSWKADRNKSGGLIYNLGIHLLDLMCYVFNLQHTPADCGINNRRGESMVDAHVNWANLCIDFKLSIDREDLPEHENSIRAITVSHGSGDLKKFEIFDFNSGFTDLHTDFYRLILDGNAPKFTDAFPSLKLAEMLTGKLYV
jgi:UDP-N-acetyl-2-amino-2-deoxyglucuronate dehydrogenase